MLYTWSCPHCNKKIEHNHPKAIENLANRHAERCNNSLRCAACNEIIKYNVNFRYIIQPDGSRKNYHSECLAEHADNGSRICSYCGVKANTIYRLSNKNEISCVNCRSELHKPITYDANATITCRCGGSTVPKWSWNGDAWDESVFNFCEDCQDNEQEMVSEKELILEKQTKNKKEQLAKEKLLEQKQIQQETVGSTSYVRAFQPQIPYDLCIRGYGSGSNNDSNQSTNNDSFDSLYNSGSNRHHITQETQKIVRVTHAGQEIIRFGKESNKLENKVEVLPDKK